MLTENRRLLRDAFGTFMTGVTVVTTLDPEGRPVGFTANSFASVSLEPPLLLVSIARSSSNFALFEGANGFAINILAETQKDISNTFAKPVADRFADIGWNIGPHGSPLLDQVAAWFDCSMHKTIDAGDHVILIGQIEAFEAKNAPGLGYCRGAYFTPAQTAATAASGPEIVVGAIIERDGQVVLVEDGAGGLTLPTSRVGNEGASATLRALIAAAGVEASPGFVYSVFENTALGHQHIAFLCPSSGGDPVKGRFYALTADELARVADSAMRSMLQRLSQEVRVGNFGVYFGNENAGEVRHGSERKQP